MNNSQRFRELVEEILKKDSTYSNELRNFLKYLEERLIEDKAFDLNSHDIDNYFVYSFDDKIGAVPTLGVHIAALKFLFKELLSKHFNFRDVYSYLFTDEIKDNLSNLLDKSFKKSIIPDSLLNSTLFKMDLYIENKSNILIKGHNDKKRLFEVMIARLYAKLSLILPIKVNEMLDFKLGDVKEPSFRSIQYNGIVIKLPNNLRNQIIDTINYAEQTYNKEYSNDDTLFGYLYGVVGQKGTTNTISTSFTKTYEEINAQEMLKARIVGTKKHYYYPAESYKTTAILQMLNNGVNIVYLKKLTGLDLNVLLSNYDFQCENKIIDIISTNLNNGIINTDYYTYI